MNNKSVVCVIGVGNIGKHHVNSLMSSGHIVYMIDPINPNIKSAFWHPELNKNILREADIFVISTTSANHYQSLKKILDESNNKIVVLEKPLFCNNHDYEEFNNISIARNDCVFYINLPIYHSMLPNLVKNNNDLGKLLEYNVSGSDWGLGCNILHDISVIDCILDIDKFIIDKLIWKLKSFEESKRRGYLEVYGDLKFNLNNLKVEISCIKNSELKKKIFMKFENGFIKLNFFDEIIEITNKKGHVTRHEIEIPKASKTTGDIISKISNGKSPIPLAKKFIKISQILYNEISKNINHKFTQKLDFPFS